MTAKISFFILLAALILVSTPALHAQGADGRGSLVPKSGNDSDDHPKSFRETLVKMRIDKEKKEFNEMLGRGEEALKLTEELENTFASTGRFDADQINKLAAVEKLVKKIRSELGGDDDGDESDEAGGPTRPLEQKEAVRSFRDATVKLLTELKKTTRFTVSTAAIQTSNAVLRLVRVLRFSH